MADQSVDPRRCFIHGLTKVERLAREVDLNSSDARISWWECPQCIKGHPRAAASDVPSHQREDR